MSTAKTKGGPDRSACNLFAQVYGAMVETVNRASSASRQKNPVEAACEWLAKRVPSVSGPAGASRDKPPVQRIGKKNAPVQGRSRG